LDDLGFGPGALFLELRRPRDSRVPEPARTAVEDRLVHHQAVVESGGIREISTLGTLTLDGAVAPQVGVTVPSPNGDHRGWVARGLLAPKASWAQRHPLPKSVALVRREASPAREPRTPLQRTSRSRATFGRASSGWRVRACAESLSRDWKDDPWPGLRPRPPNSTKGEATLYVERAARRRGVGRRLLEELAAGAERAGYWS
jgi:GNAT superfamily N-acetyltransferase